MAQEKTRSKLDWILVNSKKISHVALADARLVAGSESRVQVVNLNTLGCTFSLNLDDPLEAVWVLRSSVVWCTTRGVHQLTTSSNALTWHPFSLDTGHVRHLRVRCYEDRFFAADVTDNDNGRAGVGVYDDGINRAMGPLMPDYNPKYFYFGEPNVPRIVLYVHNPLRIGDQTFQLSMSLAGGSERTTMALPDRFTIQGWMGIGCKPIVFARWLVFLTGLVSDLVKLILEYMEPRIENLGPYTGQVQSGPVIRGTTPAGQLVIQAG
jgi:hypothetical protein